MRIGIDARELAGTPTGVGRYLSHLAAEWAAARAWARHSFVLYVPAPPTPTVERLADGLRATVDVIPGSAGTWWEQVSLPRRARTHGLDVFFAPAYTAPLLLACPTVVTIHDLSYLAHPEWFRPRERWRRGIVTRLSARRARAVLTVSQFSGDEVVRLTGIPRDRVTVVHHGVTVRGLAPAADRRDPLVLYVGSIFNRRRVPDLLRAFAKVADAIPDAELAIVGDNRTWPFQDLAALAAELGIGARARLWSYVTDDVLSSLYGRASVFVFLSEYEGFGLTPLEALAQGVPAVVVDTPVAREVYGDGAVYVPCGDIEATSRAMTSMLVDQSARRERLLAAAAVLARYSWSEAAARTLAVIESAAR